MIEKAQMSQPEKKAKKKKKKAFKCTDHPVPRQRERREGDAFREHEIQFGRT